MKLAFSAFSADDLYESVSSVLRAEVVAFQRHQPLRGQVHRLAMPRSELWRCDYGVPVSLAFADADYIRLQIPERGAGQTRASGRTSTIAGQQACISPADATIDFGEDFRQLVWRIPTELLTRKLSLLIGRPVGEALRFGQDFDIGTRSAKPLLGLLRTLLDCPPPEERGVVWQQTEIEEAMLTALLMSAEHNYRPMLDDPVASAAPWQVARVEAYIEANWHKPIGLEDLVAESGASARSIFRTFKRYRGYTPMEFLKRRRLEQAKALLADPACGKSVTEIAFDCGFADLSRFSKDFTAAYGIQPSAVRRRAKGALWLRSS